VEVLALVRWSRVDGRLGPEQARRIHLMRIFCCLVLVRASTRGGDPVNSLTPLVESAVAVAASLIVGVALMNAAAALVVAGRAKDLKEGVAIGTKSIDSGAANAKLKHLIAVSNG